jgi:hypothetical protein
VETGMSRSAVDLTAIKAAIAKEQSDRIALSARIKGYARGWNLPFMERLMGSTAVIVSRETV